MPVTQGAERAAARNTLALQLTETGESVALVTARRDAAAIADLLAAAHEAPLNPYDRRELYQRARDRAAELQQELDLLLDTTAGDGRR